VISFVSPSATLTRVLFDFLFSLLYFPVWWYTRGLKECASAAVRFIKERERGLAFFVWLKNILTPMYGQRDPVGFAISIGMRIFQIIFRGLVLLALAGLALALIMAWLALPLAVFLVLASRFHPLF